MGASTEAPTEILRTAAPVRLATAFHSSWEGLIRPFWNLYQNSLNVAGGRELTGTAHLIEPLNCTESERQDFARLVRRGFDGSDEGLPNRILDAKWLAFHYAEGRTLSAVAALKAPHEQYREEVFRNAEAGVSPTGFKLELGWVFVVPDHRGKRIAEGLCQLLLARVPGSHVFATTRPNNAPMIKILLALGFVRSGKPYPRRDEELALFLRPGKAELPERAGDHRKPFPGKRQ